MMDENFEARNEAVQPKRSLRFTIGMFFLIVNIPFAYGGGALAIAIGIKMGQPALGAGVAFGIYILSWIMLGLGIWMAGTEGVQLCNDLRKKWFRTKKVPPGPSVPSA